MRKLTGGILVGLGLLGVLGCAYGILATRTAHTRMDEGTRGLAAEARALLTRADGLLAGLPPRLEALEGEEARGRLEAALPDVEGVLATARETTASALALLRIVSTLHPEAGAVEARFPRVVRAERLLGLAQASLDAEGAKPSALQLGSAAARAFVTEARADLGAAADTVEGAERRLLDLAGWIALAVTGFLGWMGLGQLALAAAGRRRFRYAGS